MEEINYNSLSLEELEKKLIDLQKKSSDYYNQEQGIKLTLNSIYGALGNQYFACFNSDVAESVTLQGQDIWRFAEKIINKYFNEMWHLDTELHEKMGVRNVRKITLDFIIYGDTDSVFSETKILIQNESGEESRVKIGDLFKELMETEEIKTDYRGNQIIEPSGISSLNFVGESVIFSGIKKIIRHRVRKPKWKITAESGKEVIVTNDHSVTVFRKGKKIHIKPSEINIDVDEILSVDFDRHKEIEYKGKFEKIKFCECIGEFEDEYVYDLEIDEEGYDNQTFFANDILVHNSNYINLGAVMDSCEFDCDPYEFVKRLDEFRLKEYIKKCYNIYSQKCGTKNYQDFEFESLSYSGVFLGKKKYVLDVAWQAPNKDMFPRLSKIKSTGIELAQGGTAPFAREKLTFLLRHIFEKGKSFDIREFVKILKEIKNDFKVQNPDQVSIGTSVNNIEKFIVNDTKKFEVAKGCPMHVRAAGYHNYLLNNSKYKVKYSLIRSSEKIKYYYVKTKNESENNVFGYLNGSYPYELAPPIDYDEQFNRVILDPINRFVEAMGYTPLSPNLLLVKALY